VKIGFDIDTYKTRFLGGARQYLFYALIQFPLDIGYTGDKTNNVSSLLTSFGYGSGSDFVPYLVKATQVPDSTFEEIQNPYPGHPYKMAGNRTYGNWTVTFNVDAKMKILEYFTNWQDIIYQGSSKIAASPDVYMADQLLFLMDGTGEAVKVYKLVQAWPVSIGQVALDYAIGDVASIDITFSYQYFDMSDIARSSDTTQRLLKSLFNKLTGSAINIPRS
jgi:hypothetical protein